MGELKWAAYEPPSSNEEATRRQLIRLRIEELSNRPIQDHINNLNESTLDVPSWLGALFLIASIAGL